MTALNDTERAVRNWTAGRPHRPAPMRPPRSEETASERPSRYYPTWLPSRSFIAAVIAIGGMQLLATMDSTVAIVALPKIQNELSLSDAGRSWVITAYVLTFGGLMLLGGRLGDTIGRKRTFIVGVALFTISSVLCAVAWDEATLVIARLSQGVGSAIASPTGLALVATTFPKGTCPQRRDGGVRRDDRDRVGDGAGGRRSTDRGVMAVGVPGERADRAGDDLPGPHRPTGNQQRTDEARRHRGHTGHAGMHRGGFRLLDRS